MITLFYKIMFRQGKSSMNLPCSLLILHIIPLHSRANGRYKTDMFLYKCHLCCINVFTIYKGMKYSKKGFKGEVGAP